MDKLFAVCTPGLEPFLAQELEQLGLLRGKPSSPLSKMGGIEGGPEGGAEFSGTLRDVYRANLWLRTASRVLVRLGAFYAAAFPELVRKASRLPWERYLAPGQPVALRVTCHKSRLYHSGAVAERVARAIGERLGQLSPIVKFDEDNDANLPQLILVRLAHDHCTISVDSSGALLHRRGYRLATAKAPLRETLAAGMLMASGWDMTSPLLDPFCGSGTIPIEAALMARKIPPGRARRFAFMDWPNFDAATWHPLLPPYPLPLPSLGEGGGGGWMRAILASDRDAGAIKSARANAERAGVADCIEFSCRAVSAIEPPPGPGWVVTNPPYGVRVSGGRDLRNLYAQFGNVMRDKCPGWHIAMLCDSAQLIHNTGLKFDPACNIPLVNGGLKVRLSRGMVV
jgi:putative N6-adenine-specific DNA methylase